MNNYGSKTQFFIDMAKLVASKSKDRSTKVGAVIVGPDDEVRSVGYNGFPRGVDDEEDSRHERPKKYLFVAHAEANAIFNAARVGIPTKGCTLYMNFYPCPCAECTKAIIQAGIVRIVGPNVPFPGKGEQWEASLAASEEMLREAQIDWDVFE